MRRIAFLLVAVVALAGVVAYMAPASGQADGEAAPIFVIKIPPGYRDWRLISVAHEEGNLNDIARHSGQRYSDQGLPGREASVPGRHNHCPARLELRPVGGKQQSLWPSPIFRGRAPHERVQFMVKDSKKYASTGGWGFAQFNDGKPADEAVLKTCFPCHAARQSSRLCLHPLRTLVPRIIGRHLHTIIGGENMAKLTYDKEITALLVIDPYNDFISEGGKIWDRLKGVAEANHCVPNMLQVLNAARKAGLRVFYALHHRYRPGDYETWKYIAPIQKAAWLHKAFEYGTWGGEIRREFEPQPGDIVAHGALVFQRLCQHGSGFAAQEAWHSQAHRHRTHSTHVRGGNRSLCR